MPSLEKFLSQRGLGHLSVAGHIILVIFKSIAILFFLSMDLDDDIISVWKRLWKGGFIHYKPETIKETRWEADFTIAIQFNPERAKRPRGDKMSGCPLCRIKPEEKIMTLEEFDFDVFANLYPITFGHVLISKVEHIDRRVSKDDVMAMLWFTRNTSYRVIYNEVGSGASTLEHMHFQAFYEPFLVEAAKRVVVMEEDGVIISKVVSYPGICLHFEGVNVLDVLFEVVSRYIESGGFLNILFAEGGAFVVPRKEEYSERTKTKIGGLETGGKFVITDREVFDSLTREGMENILRSQVCSEGECDILSFFDS